MDLEFLPEEIRQDVFDIVQKDRQLYAILKDENKAEEDKIKNIFDEMNIQVMEFLDVVQKDFLKEFSDSISVIDQEPFIEKLGLSSVTEIVYDLTNLDQSRKMLFNYALFGRRGNDGLLQSIGGGRLTKSAIYLPSKEEEKAEDFIRNWNVRYTKRKVLIFGGN
ncbi:MAG: hypothetical protein M1441_01275 [Candidatus Parvarchaeota archaeon]|jgi:hypothetical protein|nr:hypothetical protein [Candidatus Parvarchaeota archaeon]